IEMTQLGGNGTRFPSEANSGVFLNAGEGQVVANGHVELIPLSNMSNEVSAENGDNDEEQDRSLSCRIGFPKLFGACFRQRKRGLNESQLNRYSWTYMIYSDPLNGSLPRSQSSNSPGTGSGTGSGT